MCCLVIPRPLLSRCVFKDWQCIWKSPLAKPLSRDKGSGSGRYTKYLPSSPCRSLGTKKKGEGYLPNTLPPEGYMVNPLTHIGENIGLGCPICFFPWKNRRLMGSSNAQCAHLYDKPFLRDFGTVISRVFPLPRRFAKTFRKLPIKKLPIKSCSKEARRRRNRTREETPNPPLFGPRCLRTAPITEALRAAAPEPPFFCDRMGLVQTTTKAPESQNYGKCWAKCKIPHSKLGSKTPKKHTEKYEMVMFGHSRIFQLAFLVFSGPNRGGGGILFLCPIFCQFWDSEVLVVCASPEGW